MFTLSPDGLRQRMVAAGLFGAGYLTQPLGHRGFSRLAERLGRHAPAQAMATVMLAPECFFQFPLADAYWNRLLSPCYRYEPEIGHVLHRLAGWRPLAFIDGGANLGFWSVRASAPGLGVRQVVAIEALPELIPLLEHNAKLNGKRFQVLHRALHARDGQQVRIANPEAHHSAASVALVNGDGVPTISLRTLLDQLEPGVLPLIKLDVEGAEEAVLVACPELFDGSAVVIFEDHGRERNSPLTQRLLADARVQVFHISPSGTCRRLSSVAQVDALKSNPHQGYNFVAVSGPEVMARFLNSNPNKGLSS